MLNRHAYNYELKGIYKNITLFFNSAPMLEKYANLIRTESELWYIHTLEHDMAENEILLYIAILRIAKYHLRKKIQTEKNACCLISFV